MKVEHTYKLIWNSINNLQEEFNGRELRTLKKMAYENDIIRHLVCGTYLLEKNTENYDEVFAIMIDELHNIMQQQLHVSYRGRV